MAIQLNPNDSGNYFDRGELYYRLKKYHEALKDFNKYVELARRDPNGYNYRGLVKYELKLYQEAINDYTLAISLNLIDPEPYYNRASARLKLNDLDSFDSDWRKAKEAKKISRELGLK